MMRTNQKMTFNFSPQTGLALPMTLILLLVMTILGVASLRMTMMDEQMVGNNRLREIAFNAAESTLVFAENEIVNSSLDLRTVVFFDGDRPDGTNADPGDTCTSGYCTASQYDAASNSERWLDTTLNVWDETDKHLTYDNFSTSGLDNEGIYTAPKYIVEFLGNYYDEDESNSDCYVSATNSIPAIDRTWPYCANDPQVVRITALAAAGDPQRGSRVMLQSTIVFEN